MSQLLFTHFRYSSHTHKAQLHLLDREQSAYHFIEPNNQPLTLQFDTTQRYCTGWHDLAAGVTYPCSDAASLPEAYHECRHCQQKTGFNPAFYHASSISPQQQARNQSPHLLYLAHFGPGVLKVGISWAARGKGRLLDQGARSYLLLKTFSTAEEARAMEASIAALPGISEALQSRTKHNLLHRPYDTAAGSAELLNCRDLLESTLNTTFEARTPEALDTFYLIQPLRHSSLVSLDTKKISGQFIGMIGSTLILQQDDVQFMLSLNKFRGYPVSISDSIETNTHAPLQTSLF